LPGKLSTINARCLHRLSNRRLVPLLSPQLSYARLLLADFIRHIPIRSTFTQVYYCAITAFFLLATYQFILNIFLCMLYCLYEMLSSFFFVIRKCLFPNNGEVTSLIHRSSDKLSAILEARRPPPFLPQQPFASAFPLVFCSLSPSIHGWHGRTVSLAETLYGAQIRFLPVLGIGKSI
jgi:hypothetical protein